ncbi:unnamed protein product [Toxocara canis]|uniref:LFG1 protein n=1 Tax=Toxocara canis TaxID=6265 RepID=A0A183UMX1_TOXCA|nr:unnamed protein product [Toxocara canis]
MEETNNASANPSASSRDAPQIPANPAVPTRSFETVGSTEMYAERNLSCLDWIRMFYDRQCTSVLCVYFTGVAVLLAITAAIIAFVGFQRDWNYFI